jgi:uncharacterized membrane protein YfcA
MEILIPCLVALLASILTFFSGFGLGTLLLPAFAFFVPVHDAILLTALVHMLNNLFKLILIGKHVAFDLALKFSLFTIPASFLGSFALDYLEEINPIYAYTLGSELHEITSVKVLIGLLMLVFAGFEVIPRWKAFQFPTKLLPVGAILSGFFGGLSGHQGALRSAFLVRAGLSKEAFIATGIVIALVIDATRIPYYLYSFGQSSANSQTLLWFLPTLCAFAGAYTGSKLLKKVQIGFVQTTVAILLLVIALLLIFGIL